MLAYFILLFLICLDFGIELLLKKLNVISEDNKNLKWWQKVLKCVFNFRIITITSLIFLSTFRSYEVGMDIIGVYIRDYNKGIINSSYEMGYGYLCYLCLLLNLPFRVVMFVISVFVSISFIVFIKKLSPNKFLSMLLYVALGYFALSLNLLRQIVGIAFVLLAILKLLDDNKEQALILVFFGAFFHKTALLGLLVLAVYYIKPNIHYIIPILLLAILGSLIFPYGMKLLESVTSIDYYSKYFVNDTEFIGKTDIVNILYTLGLFAIFAVLFVTRKKFLILDDKSGKLYDYFMMLFLFVPVIRMVGFLLNAQELFHRLSHYFFFSLIILIPLFIKGLKHVPKVQITAIVSSLVISLGYMYYLYAIKLSCGVVPYFLCF